MDRDRQTVLWPAGWNVRLQGEQSSRGAEEGIEAQRDQGEAEPDRQRESHESAGQGGRAGILHAVPKPSVFCAIKLQITDFGLF